jgi:uncharacterized membrane protein
MDQPSWASRHGRTVVIAALMIFLFIIGTTFQYKWTRMFHIVSGFFWYAMLIFLVIVFLPIANQFSDTTLYEIVGRIVPRIFHTVTVSGFFAVSFGWYNALYLADGRYSYFHSQPIDVLFSFSMILVTLMYLFHLFLESSEINVSSGVAAGEIAMDSDEYQTLIKGLRLTPRVGFLIISFAIFIMFLHQ